MIDSGLNYLIVRTGATDRVPDSYGEEANPVVASFGTLPPGLSVARSQVCPHSGWWWWLCSMGGQSWCRPILPSCEKSLWPKGSRLLTSYVRDGCMLRCCSVLSKASPHVSPLG